jgi:hypothetical protein
MRIEQLGPLWIGSLILVACLFVVPTACASNNVDNWDRTAEENAVYWAIADSVMQPPIRMAVLERSTSGPIPMDTLPPIYWTQLPLERRVQEEIFRDYRSANSRPEPAEVIGSGRVKLVVVDDTVFTNFPRALVPPPAAGQPKTPDFWRTFRARYPDAGGILSMTRPGFSRDHSLAVAEVGTRCGILCGAGQYVVLRKVDGVWRVVHILTYVVS